MEVAAADGAGPTPSFLPAFFCRLLRRSFLPAGGQPVCLFDTFPVIDAATAGGRYTTTLGFIRSIAKGFHHSIFGVRRAVGVLMFLVNILTVVQFRYVESKVRY